MDGYTSTDAPAEVEQRKQELDAYVYNDAKAASPTKKKNKKILPIPNENHMKMRANVEEGDK
jgi:hypothetical protein